jgi:hypothetical protein
VLNNIANADGDGNYMVSWSEVNGATSYVLEEDDNAAFSSPDTQYTGPDTSWNASGKAAGTYFYRVKASNSVGDSDWSNVESVNVLPAPDHYVGSSPSVSFDVIGQQVCDFDITVPFLSSSCHLRTKSGVCFEIENDSFRIEEYVDDLGLVNLIKGTFSSNRINASGNYSVQLCGREYAITPQKGTWEAGKQ